MDKAKIIFIKRTFLGLLLVVGLARSSMYSMTGETKQVATVTTSYEGLPTLISKFDQVFIFQGYMYGAVSVGDQQFCYRSKQSGCFIDNSGNRFEKIEGIEYSRALDGGYSYGLCIPYVHYLLRFVPLANLGATTSTGLYAQYYLKLAYAMNEETKRVATVTTSSSDEDLPTLISKFDQVFILQGFIYGAVSVGNQQFYYRSKESGSVVDNNGNRFESIAHVYYLEAIKKIESYGLCIPPVNYLLRSLPLANLSATTSKGLSAQYYLHLSNILAKKV